MSPNPSAPGTSRRIIRIACAVAVLSFVAGRLPAQNPPAIVDRPMAPASNDTPDEQPSPQHVWVAGHWHWSEGSYVWVAGHWETPPIPGATWLAPQWMPQGSGYVLQEGSWQQSPASPAPQSATEVFTNQPPPPPPPQAIPERPSPAHVWLPGYWAWQNNRFEWVAGHWEIPPRPNVTWIPSHWEARGDRFVLAAGYWRDNVVTAPAPTQVVVAQPAPATQVVVVAAPPPPRTEVVYGRPSRFHVWVPGYRGWSDGHYVWIAGHWERPPRGHQVWESPRWERRGGSYVFIEGHWR